MYTEKNRLFYDFLLLDKVTKQRNKEIIRRRRQSYTICCNQQYPKKLANNNKEPHSLISL